MSTALADGLDPLIGAYLGSGRRFEQQLSEIGGVARECAGVIPGRGSRWFVVGGSSRIVGLLVGVLLGLVDDLQHTQERDQID